MEGIFARGSREVVTDDGTKINIAKIPFTVAYCDGSSKELSRK